MIHSSSLRRSPLTHPFFLLALVVLVLNDWVLKGSRLLPGVVTGKLSDFAGLLVFPIVLAMGSRWVLGGHPPVRTACTLLVGVTFSLMKTVPWVNTLVASVMGPVVLDPTDLLALPMLGVAWSLLGPSRTTARPARPSSHETAIAIAASLACAATSQPPVRNFPEWRAVQGENGLYGRDVGCAHLLVYVSKSGKQGMGVTVENEGCPATVSGTFRAGDVHVDATRADATAETPGYLAFPFNNERLWNDEQKSGALTLLVSTSQGQQRIALQLSHIHEGYHRFERGRSEPARPPMPVATGPIAPASSVGPVGEQP